MSCSKPFDLAEHIAGVVDQAPSWDELPIESRSTLLRLFRPSVVAWGCSDCSDTASCAVLGCSKTRGRSA